MIRYSLEIEERMRLYFAKLGEKDRRHYAAVEADKLGYGGQRYIAQLFDIHVERVYNGLKELKNPTLLADIPLGKQRRAGGGRKKKK
jgi:hypothetical protein|tara:strand:+ start:43 stop:303 length:261 start_codon:yes stop_codon:yes gene_type:complete